MFRILEWSKPIKILVVKGIVKSKRLWTPLLSAILHLRRRDLVNFGLETSLQLRTNYVN